MKEKHPDDIFDQFFENSIDLLCIADTEGYFKKLNPEWVRTLGYSLNELEGKQFIDFVHPDDKIKTIETTKKLASKEKITGFVNRYRHKDGSYRWIEWRSFSANNLIYASARNVTEQKQYIEKLKNSEARLKKAQEIGHIGYSEQIFGSNETWASAQGMGLFGFPPVEGYISNEKIKECIADINHFGKALRELIEQNRKFDIEYLINPADGSAQRYIHAIAEIEKDEKGKPIKIHSIFQDITVQKKIEEEIKKLNNELEARVFERTVQLEQANKDLESFAYSISHDLRAPLRHVDGFVRLMYSNIPTPTSIISNYFEKIEVASKRMSGMIDDLLTFSRLGRKELKLTPVKLNKLINEIIDQFKPDYNQRSFRWKIGNLPDINADLSLLRVVFDNIISNTIKYTSKKEEAAIEIDTIPSASHMVTIYIKDNGAGFDMKYANKLFGVFQRLHTNEEFEGTGIGLANVKQIITKHKGTVWAESTLNLGATFFISLPK